MAAIKISTFNVNSIRARLDNFLKWIETSKPDIVLLQELKCLEENFPFSEIFDAGYNAAVYGQKSYNGVAILSKFKITDITKGLPNFSDPQARYIEAVVNIYDKVLRVSSIYVPNGGGELAENEKLENSEKFSYKINFLEKLKQHLSDLFLYHEDQIFAGDFNVANQYQDVYDAKILTNSVCFHPLEQEKFRSILNLGYIDSFRAKYPNSKEFSWWDYRGGNYQHNLGLRIDYLLSSPKLADKIIDCKIENIGVRNQEKSSDHCPVSLIIDL
jgi:exodeoxyribonuclease-3